MTARETVVAIHNVTRAVAAAESFDAVCAVAIDCVRSTLRADRASLLLADDAGVMRFRAWEGLSEGYRARTEGHSPWAADAVDADVVAIPDAREAPELGVLRDVVVQEGIGGLLFVPLRARGRLLGKFMVYYDAPHAFDEVELYLARILGDQLGFALARFGAEERACLASAELRAVLEAVPDGVTVHDAGGIRYANDAAARLMGLPSGASMAATPIAQLQSPYEMIAEDGAPLHPRDLPGRRALAGEPASMLVGYRRLGGREVKWSRVVSQPCRAPDGTVRFAVTVTQDVTRARRESETRRFLLEASALLSSSLELETTLGALAALAVPRLADWCAVELVGADGTVALRKVGHRDPAKFVLAQILMSKYRPPADAPDGLPHVYRTGEPWLVRECTPEMLVSGAVNDEHREVLEKLALCSTLVVPLRVRGVVIGTLQLANAESGRLFGEDDLAIVLPLADRAAIAVDHARLYGSERDAREKLELAMRAGRMGNWEYDVERSTVWWSPAVAALHGIPASEFGGTFDAFLRDIVPADRDRVISSVAAAVRNGDDLVIEYRICRGDGAVRWVEGRGRVYRDAAGRALRLAGFCLDVSDRKEAEEALHLERERLGKLESIGVLAGGIAHDFNNILTTITGNVSLAEHLLDKRHPARDRLAAARTGSERARDITRQLLTFSRGGAPVKAATSLEEVVREACAFALQGARVKAEFTFEPGLAPVDADAGQIGQVVHNLVLNAAQAMPGGGRVHVRARDVVIAADTWPPVTPGRYVRLDVEDTGPGIPPEALPRIFDPFFTTKPSGTGLGLATSYSIARRHGGHLGVESPPGSGARFVVHLPVSNEAPVPGPASPAPRTGRGRVLVMDDDPAVLDLAGACLRTLGYDADLATDGGVAVERYSAAHVAGAPHDLLIVDLTVPGGVGGEEAVRRLRAQFPGVRAVVSSGYSNDPVTARYRDHGFVAVLQKPYALDELARVVHEAIGR